MATDYPIRFAAQLRQHLKAFRKARNLTQAQLGDLVGVRQARIAEIEANPGLVRFEQLMQILSALGVTLVLNEDLSKWQAPTLSENAKRTARKTTAARYVLPEDASWRVVGGGDVLPRYSVRLPTGSWSAAALGTAQAPTSLVVPPGANAPTNKNTKFALTRASPKKATSALETLRALNPGSDVQPTSRRNFIVRPKKGTW